VVLYYRGSLSSCNYACPYCPFAKTRHSRQQLQQDRQELSRFSNWVEAYSQPLSILFTPWGEGLIHAHYRQALVRLSQLPQIQQVCIQTNLSAPLHDLAQADPSRLALWTTYHPDQVPLQKFLGQCQQLSSMSIPYSVGVVGLKEHFAAIEELRQSLPPQVYLWINAYKRQPDYYQGNDIERLQKIDPWFFLNLPRYRSLGQDCQAGRNHFTVDGDGQIRRCHFVDQPLANLYQDPPQAWLEPSPCPQATCGCYIGYIHQEKLALQTLYGRNLLARIPSSW
jgi:MoaA/NifB/PqqE/SkfB family radical SAM enzyme